MINYWPLIGIALVVAGFALPALANPAWQASRPQGSDLPHLVGGTWWAGMRLLMSAIVLVIV